MYDTLIPIPPLRYLNWKLNGSGEQREKNAMYDNDVAALTTTDRIIRDRGGFVLHIYPYFFRLRLLMPNLLVKMVISNPSFALHC